MDLFIQRFMELKQKYKLAPIELANELSIDYDYYKSIVSEQVKPDIDFLVSASNYFDVTIDYLLGKSDVPNIYYIDIKNNSKVQKMIYDIMNKRKINKYDFCSKLQINEVLFEQKLIHNDFTLNELNNILQLLECTYHIVVRIYDKDKKEIYFDTM